MKLEKTIEEIEDGREKVESSFVFGLVNNPELIDDYEGIDKDGETILHNEDAIFYYNLARAMWNAGFRQFDALAYESFLSDKPKLKKRYEGYGGYPTISNLKALATSENVDANYDNILKRNMLIKIAREYEHVFADVSKFASSTAEDVYNVFDLIANKASLEEGRREEIVELSVTKEYIQSCLDGEEVGLSYSQPKTSTILNSATLGLPCPGVSMIAGHSGKGKSSMAFEVVIMGLIKNGIHCGIIANEMNIRKFQGLLTAHILREHFHNYTITRTKLAKGKISDEETKLLMDEVTKISEEKYAPYLHFVKMYGNSMNQVIKQLKRMRSQYGVQAVLYDTYKADDEVSGNSMWEELLLSSRKLFKTCDKLNLALLCTYQLAPASANQRYLDVSALSSSKMVKEILETLLFMRPLFPSEYTAEKDDCKAYRLKKKEDGEEWERENIELDPNEKYYVVFVDKTRNNESDVCILYRARLRYNEWKEVGFCKIKRDYVKTY